MFLFIVDAWTFRHESPDLSAGDLSDTIQHSTETVGSTEARTDLSENTLVKMNDVYHLSVSSGPANYNTLMYTTIFVVNTLWQRQESMDQLWLKPFQGIKEESTIKSFETFVQTKYKHYSIPIGYRKNYQYVLSD